MLTLKLYPSQFRELLCYLHMSTDGQQSLPLTMQHVGKLVLLNYLSRWTPSRLYVWKQRRSTKEYSFRLPVVVGLALYQDMDSDGLTEQQQLVRDQLDKAIVDYRVPYTHAPVRGDLMNHTLLK